MAAFPLASLGTDKAAYGIAAYTLFVLLEAHLGTAGCLAAEAVVMGVVLMGAKCMSSGKEVPASPESVVAEEPEKPAGKSSQPDVRTESTRRSGPANSDRRVSAQPAQTVQQPSSGKPIETATASSKGGACAPAAVALRPSAGSWAAQAAQRRKQEEASGQASFGSHAAQAPPKSGAAAPARTPPAGGASAPAPPALQSSAGSWAAQQRKKREEAGGGCDSSDAEFARSVKSILNKLTVEKFDALYAKLIACGIRTPAHVEILVGEIVDKARAQHHFVKMYAELCARLNGEFAALAGCNFKWILLDKCQQSFESSLKPSEEAVGEGDADEAKAKHKERMLGNVKLTGELLLRQMLSSKVLIACAEDLLESPPVVDRLECLAVLLQVTGQAFDNPVWTQHATLVAIFATVSDLSQTPSVPSRVRCLLQDVLDLRAAGWVDSRAVTRVEGPKRLEEVQKEAAAECVFVDKPKREWEPRAEGVTPSGAQAQPLAPGSRSDTPCAHWAKYACKFGRQCAFSHEGPGGNAPAEGSWEGCRALGSQASAHAPAQVAPDGRARQGSWRARQAVSQESWRARQSPPQACQLQPPAGANWQRLRTCLDFA